MTSETQSHPYSTGQLAFRKIFRRSLVWPLVLSTLTAGVLIGLVFYLLASARWVDHSDQVISVARNYEKQIIDSETGMRGYLLRREKEFLQPFERARTSLPLVQLRLRHLVANSPGELAAVDAIARSYQSWLSLAEEMIGGKRAGRNVTDGRAGKAQMDAIRDQFETFLNDAERLRDERYHHTAQLAGVAVFLTLILSLILAAAFAAMSRKHLRLLSEEYETALRGQEENNEILRDTDWIKSGLAELSRRIMGELTGEELTRSAVQYLAERTEAKIGVLYAAREGRTLERLAGLGLPIEATACPRTIAFGETLVGQAARDQRPLFLGPQDGDYPLRTETALAAIPPRALAVLPLTADRVTKGVMELAFLAEIAPRVKDFLQQAAVLVGHALKSAEYRQQLVLLLEESQRQAEELNIQSEELKQTNEQLEQQSHEMQAQQALLEQTNNELEAQQITLQEKKEALEASNRTLAEMHRNLREQAERLALANRYKSEFLANMSHELRTPLNSILILAKLLEDQPQDYRAVRESATTIHTSALDLLSLINDILDLSKIEAGRLEIRPQPMELAGFAEKLRKTFLPLAATKQLAFRIDLKEGLPAEIVCDELRLEQILRNFISNAIKFTEHGEVTVTFGPAADGDQSAIEIAVRDTGIGIPPEKQQLIFEAFEQIDGSDARRHGGTGLGLTIARRLSQLLRGRISVSSRTGSGSVFSLRLPRQSESSGQSPAGSKALGSASESAAPEAPRPTAASEPVAESPPAPKRLVVNGDLRDDRGGLNRRDKVVQIIEDDPIFAAHLMDIARSRGFKCVISTDGESGWRDAEVLTPDAILLDLRLPRLNGLAVLDKLKSDPKTAGIPVHVLSASDDRSSALEKGAVEVLGKPASRAELNALVDRIEQTRVGPLRDLHRVLVVEDSATDRAALTRLLQRRGLEVHGTDRLARAREIYQEHSIDLVLVDLTLADGSGFELLDFIRQQHGRRSGVIVYTARDLTDEEKLRLSDCSDTIVVKGAKSLERLLQEVTLFLRGVERELPSPAAFGTAPTPHRDQSLSGKVALVADDDMRNAFALRRVLDSRGVRTVVARTGREALQRLEESPRIDIVLMDVMMPEMDGLEAMRRIRGQERWRKLPMLALTAKAMTGDREKCLQAGADDYLAKPIEYDRLLGLVKVWLNKV